MEKTIMKANPNTIVGDLAICSNCGKVLHYIREYGIWIHFEGKHKQLCAN